MIRLIDGAAKIVGLAVVVGAVWFLAQDNKLVGEAGVSYLPSFVFVALVLLGVTFLSFEASRLLGLLRMILQSPAAYEARLRRVEGMLMEASEAYYQRGPQALAEVGDEKEVTPIWTLMRSKVAARIGFDDVRLLVGNESAKLEQRMDAFIGVVASLASLAPSVGVLGTVVGLIRLLADLSDLRSLGPNMSLALVTTLCGLGFSVLIFSPLEARLKSLKDLQLEATQVTLFWVYLVENSKPAFYNEPEA